MNILSRAGLEELCCIYLQRIVELENENESLKSLVDALKDCYNCKYNNEGSEGCEGCNPDTIPKWEHFK
jgi:hypothetical protein